MIKLRGIIVTGEVDEFRSIFREYNEEVFDIVAVVNNGFDCLKILQTEQVDFVLTDAFMSVMDGYVLLDMINSQLTDNVPFVYFMSTYRDEFYVNRAINLGAKYYFVKPINPDSFYRVLKQDFVILEGKMLEERFIKNSTNVGAKAIEEKLSKVFLMLGIPAHIKGYKYLRDAVKLVLEDGNIINSITKKLYPAIAVLHDTSSSKVERAIRHAIEVAWNRGKLENLNKIFGLKFYTDHEKPTNGEFIALVADKILLEQAV